ncbi:MAG TPA: hypothetical protein VK590_09450 [Saprospiraceae bacterium]|nr:hypothetical protein [Saprospiraceae bacterium]
MIQEVRATFNQQFSETKHQAVLNELGSYFGIPPGFRVAETPVFLPAYFKQKLIEASNEIVNGFMEKDYLKISLKSIPDEWNTPGFSEHPNFMVLDYGICLDEDGSLKPMLIEAQGFPSVFYFQMSLDRAFRANYDIPAGFSSYFENGNETYFKQLLEETILNGHPKEEVILLELEPQKQTTLVDFIGTEKELGIKTICVSELLKDGKELYYMNGKKKQLITRIYNRVIADDWAQRPDITSAFKFTDEVNVSWAGHPNWFFKVSKFGLPYLDSSYVPKTTILSKLSNIPEDLENYVLKPLFSFSGSGVVFNVLPEDIQNVKEPENYILQKKVNYYPGIQSPDGMVKCELRVMLIWPDKADKPIFTTNLTRLSKGELIGVKFNRNKIWVGGSLSYFAE